MATFRAGTVNNTSYAAAAGHTTTRTIVAGDLCVWPFTWEDSQTLTSPVVDTYGGVWLIASQQAHGAAPQPIAAVAYCLSHPGGSSAVVSGTLSGTANPILEADLMCFIPGGGNTFVLDGVATPGTGTGSTFSAGAVTTTGPGVFVEFVAGFQLTAGVAVGGTPTFTRDTGTENVGVGRSFAQYLLSGSAQTITPGASWSALGAKWVMLGVAFKEVAAGATDDVPPACFPDDAGEDFEVGLWDFYADHGTVNRADVVIPAIPDPELPRAYEWEDPNVGDAALWLWPMAQAPPIADVVALDYIQPFDSDEQPEYPEEDFGFSADPTPDDIFDQLSNEFDGYAGEEDELFDFTHTPLEDTPVADLAAQHFPDSIEDPEPVEGFSDAPLSADDLPQQGVNEDGSYQDPEDEPFGFDLAAAVADVEPDQIWAEDATKQPPDPEDEPYGFEQAPLSADVLDPMPVECSDAQPPFPEEDENFGFEAGPLADDVFDLNIVWQDDAANQQDTPDDEAYGFSAEPLPDDVEQVPVVSVDGGRRRRPYYGPPQEEIRNAVPPGIELEPPLPAIPLPPEPVVEIGTEPVLPGALPSDPEPAEDPEDDQEERRRQRIRRHNQAAMAAAELLLLGG